MGGGTDKEEIGHDLRRTARLAKTDCQRDNRARQRTVTGVGEGDGRWDARDLESQNGDGGQSREVVRTICPGIWHPETVLSRLSRLGLSWA